MKHIIAILALSVMCGTAHNAEATKRYINGSGAQYVGVQGTYEIGNDTTGNGTIGAPWATWTKALAAATAGDSVYIAQNSHTENVTGDKALKWFADGTVSLESASGNYTFINSQSQYLYGFTFSRSAGYIIYNGAGETTTLDSCTIALTETAQLYLNDASFVNSSIIIDNCTISVNVNATRYGIYSLTQPGFKLNISQSTLNFNGGDGILRAVTTAGLTETTTINRCDININAAQATVSAAILSFNSTDGVADSLYFTHNTVVIDSLDFLETVDYLTNIISVSGGTRADITNNTFDASANEDRIRLIWSSSSDTVYVSNNILRHKAVNGEAISVIGAGAYYVIGNSFYGPNYYGVDPEGYHGLYSKGVANILFFDNYINGSGYGIIMKGAEASGVHTLLSGGIKNNVIVNCEDAGILIKGMKGATAYHNTMTINSDKTSLLFGGLHLGVNDLGDITGAAILKNNIVAYYNADGYRGLRIDAGCDSALTSNNNIFYQVNTDSALVVSGTTSYANIAAWKVSGFDANSISSDPLIDVNYRPAYGSPALGMGVDVGLTADRDGITYNGVFPAGAYTRLDSRAGAHDISPSVDWVTRYTVPPRQWMGAGYEWESGYTYIGPLYYFYASTGYIRRFLFKAGYKPPLFGDNVKQPIWSNQ